MATAAHAHIFANIVHKLKVRLEHFAPFESLVAVRAGARLVCVLQHVRATRPSRLEPRIALGAREVAPSVRALVLGQPSKTRVATPTNTLANFLVLQKVMLLCEAAATRARKGTTVRACMSKIREARATPLATRAPIAPLPVYMPSHAQGRLATLQTRTYTRKGFFHENEIYSRSAGCAGRGDKSPRVRQPRIMNTSSSGRAGSAGLG